MLMNMAPDDAGDIVFRVPDTSISITTAVHVQGDYKANILAFY